MTIKQYHTCLQELANYADQSAYVSDLALSSMWIDPAEAVPQSRIDALTAIWSAAHRGIADIAAAAGLSQRKLAERCGIPYRTIEAWSAGDRQPPLYVLLLIQEALHLLQLDIS